ncbi:MAG: DNA replication and repair protein RecF [Bacteroidales bacterium]|nr:DNA replication and repair protein RecF [Bacteroidales bacterium]
MNLQRIKINNFKNISDVKLDLSAKINCLVGDNGTGKTNFLDAIYYLAFTRSYFNHIDNQNIKHNENFFLVEGKFLKKDDISSVKSSFSAEKGKTVKLNDKKHKKLSDHFGMFPVVMITPFDIDLILDGSELRRNFIDSIIAQYDREYLISLINYKKSLLQRNTLLKKFAENSFFDKGMLEIWDYKLVELSPIIYNKRKAFFDEYIDIFDEYYKKISGTNENVNIEYKSDLQESDIETILKNSLKKDLAIQRTSAGIHKDDLIFTINGYQLKKTASQGQQKTFVTSLKFAQTNFIKEHTGFRPILLLDDIFDKLDNNRVENVVNLVSDNHFGQIFITHTDKEKLEEILKPAKVDFSIIEVDSGNFKTL